MEALIGKLLIYLACTFVQYKVYPVNLTYIAILLIAFIAGFHNFSFYIEKTTSKSLYSRLFLLTYLIAGFFIPQLLVFVPFLCWDIFDTKNIPEFLLVIGNLVYIFLYFDVTVFVILLFFCFFSIFIKKITYKNANLEQELKRLRDTSTEHSLLIEEKNRVLLENQDNKIYTATLKERNRIAREIHDNVGHMLTRSILQIGAIKTINQNEVLKEPLNTLHDTLNTAMTSIRESVHDLHDESIDLKQAIYEIIEQVDCLQVAFDYDMSKNLPRNVKYSFISIVKEGVNNTLKHSNAQNLTILLREHPGFYQLLIEDDGTAISTETSSGIGLTNIQDRVNALHGTLKISTEHGFQILISIFKERIS